MSVKLVIAGGSDAGISAGLRAKELNPKCEVTIVVADRFPNYSICGLPFYLSGEVRDWRALAHRTIEELSGAGLSLLLDQRVQAFDPDNHRVTVIDESGQARYLPYDRLIIATGATSIYPSIAGLNLPGVFFLRFMEDAFAVHQHLETRAPRKAVIIGGGYIGMEMADALTRRGLSVTGDRKTGLLLGAQMLGNVHSEIAKRIDIFATALFHNMRVEELNDLDLSYTPPLSSPWDPVQMSAQTWVKALQ
jgi:NADPH-dependent 2,4-dienoyl-CoA reductase/sulfur reductase-like enzyme